MIVYGGGGRGGRGCFILPLGLFFIIAAGMGLTSLLPLLILAFVGFLLFKAVSSSSGRVVPPPSAYSDEWYDRQPATVPDPTRLDSIRKLHKSVMQSIAKNAKNPALSAVLPDIREQCNELLGSAERIWASRLELDAHRKDEAPSTREIHGLAMQVDLEKNEKIKAAMLATLERKRAEMDTREKISEQVRYLDALLGQAEATLSELKSRISLTLAETEQYTDPRQALSLTESSDQIRTVSEEMRQTLGEL